MKSMIAFFAAALLSAQALASEPDICSRFNSAIERSQKQIAIEMSDGMFDNSAPRETSRRLSINNELLLMGMNFSLLSQNKCKPSTDPVVFSFPGYFTAAMECRTDQISGKKDSEKCKRENWSK